MRQLRHEVEAEVRISTAHRAISAAYDANLQNAIGTPAVALEVLRQFCVCSRIPHEGKRLLDEELLILIEAAGLVVPEGGWTGCFPALSQPEAQAGLILTT